MRYITDDDVRNAFPGVIATQGENYVYPNEYGCFYVKNDKPSCMLGVYLIDVLGIPKDYFSEMRSQFGREPIQKNESEFDNIAADIEARFDIQFEPGLVDRLREVQEYQDNGCAWGIAYKSVFEPESVEEN